RHTRFSRDWSSDVCSSDLDGTIPVNSEIIIINTVTIDATGHDVTLRGGGSNRIFNVSGGNLTLTNVKIENGNGVSTGGGIYNNGGTVTLNNSTVSGNTATNYGGGIYNTSSGTVTITNNSTVSGNTAGSHGGGIYNGGGTVTITNSTVSGNTATSGNGGGIYNQNGPTVMLTI